MATLDASATQTSGWHAPGWYLAHELVGDLLVPRTYAFYRYMREHCSGADLTYRCGCHIAASVATQ